MASLIRIASFIFILMLPLHSLADDLPPFFETITYDAFFPGGLQGWKLQYKVAEENNVQFDWVNAENHKITLKYRNAEPNTVQGVYQGLAEEVDRAMKEKGGNLVTVKEFFAVVLMQEDESNNSISVLYGTPKGAYLWKYRAANTAKINYDAYLNSVSFAVREQQYDEAVKLGNVVLGHWGGPIHEYAKLLASKKDKRTETVYRTLLETSPSNYEAHAEFIAITNKKDERIQSAKIIARDAEEENILNISAKTLNKEIPSISDFPQLSKSDKGLSVILIPLTPCNPWLLRDIAVTYQKITTIPVDIRRIPVAWNPPKPSRSVYRPYLEKIASGILKTQSNFSDWSLSQLKEEIMKKAKEEGPSAVIAVEQLFKKIDEQGYQWNADPIMNWLSKEIAPYYSKDPLTMVVGITELDIYSGDSNFVFSVFGGYPETPVSILSYGKMRAKMWGEKQSRKRLTERAAKELVPASLKKLNIPRSTDPSCPYSYSSGLPRLDEKSLKLSDPVKKEIKRIKQSVSTSWNMDSIENK